MSKFISKQSVAVWYVLSALFATYIVGQVILWCFPDRSSLGASFSGMLALLGTPSWPSYYIFPGPFYMGGWKK